MPSRVEEHSEGRAGVVAGLLAPSASTTVSAVSRVSTGEACEAMVGTLWLSKDSNEPPARDRCTTASGPADGVDQYALLRLITLPCLRWVVRIR